MSLGFTLIIKIIALIVIALFIHFEHELFSDLGDIFLMLEVHPDDIFLQFLNLSKKTAIFDVSLFDCQLQIKILNKQFVETEDKGSKNLPHGVEVVVFGIVKDSSLVVVLILGFRSQQFSIFALTKL